MRELVMNYWIETAMGGILAIVAVVYRKLSGRIKRSNVENQALKSGMCALLRDRIIQGYNHYHAKGCWPIYARDSMQDMYKQYEALGGNGTIPSLMRDLSDMPTEKQ